MTSTSSEPDLESTSLATRPGIPLALTFLAVIGFIPAAIYCLLALLFLGNFNLANLWHLFVMAYTFLIPILSLACIVTYHVRPNRITMLVSALFSVATLAIWLLWSASASRGLIH
jgi:hypothetical protein